MVKLASEVLAGLAALPETDIATFLVGRTALVMAPHQDDETLGCGGLIAAACALGLPPVVVFLTDGAASHVGSPSFPPERLSEVRRDEALAALAALGMPPERAVFLGYPDGKLPGEGAEAARLLDELEALIRAQGCGLILAPWIEDPHCDHQAAARLARAVGARGEAALFFYSVWGWLLPAGAPVHAIPSPGGCRLPVEAQLPRKRLAIAAHSSQTGELITDAAQAFILPEALIAVALRPHEVVFPV